MKLIEINTDHYVIVDENAEIKEGDWFIGSDNKILLCKKTILGLLYSENDYGRNKNGCKKITHSTDIDINELYYISLQEVKELLGVVDVEKKVRDYYEKDKTLNSPSSFKAGYNQALEDNKEKKWTDEDLRKAWDSGREYANDYWEARGEKYMINFDNFIQSVQAKTEWEVEFDSQGKLKLI